MNEAILKALPEEPGVYFFFDQKGEILYIGKSVNLKKRIHNHFSERKEVLFQVVRRENTKKAIVSKTTWDYTIEYLEKAPLIRYNKELKKKKTIKKSTSEIKYVITETAEEAFTLEGCLIATIKPTLNQTTWSYPFIEITLAEPIPRLVLTYQISNPQSFIFGPFNIGAQIETAIAGFLRIIPLCNYEKPLHPKRRPHCFKAAFKQCLAPCKKPQELKAYQQQVREFIEQLNERGKDVVKRLEQFMEEEKNSERFEAAAKSRDQIQAIHTLFEYKVFPFILKKYLPQLQEVLAHKPAYLNLLEKMVRSPTS